jgi:hypothetical protein
MNGVPMSAQSKAQLITNIREIVGDDNSSSYFLSDARWGRIIDTAERRLGKYIKLEDEELVSGTGATSYTIPVAAQRVHWTNIFVRSGADQTTDIELKGYKTNENTIYSTYPINSGESLVFWIKRPFIVGTDEISEDALEIFYKLCEIEYCTYAIASRQDYVAWASLNRSDASINQLILSKQELKRDLMDWVREMGEGTDVNDAGGY